MFADGDAYGRFETEVRELGLSDSYTVSSSDLTAFENQLLPLDTLSKMAGYFLIVVLLTLVAGSVSMLFIMRYDPLKLLANRD